VDECEEVGVVSPKMAAQSILKLDERNVDSFRSSLPFESSWENRANVQVTS
jgi:hypothetical protein